MDKSYGGYLGSAIPTTHGSWPMGRTGFGGRPKTRGHPVAAFWSGTWAEAPVPTRQQEADTSLQ
jgi:hypothetical protein